MTLKFTNPDDLKQKTYYLAGKMSGLPQFNIPEFFRVASELRKQGHKIVNPAELDTEECRLACLRSLTGDKEDLPKAETWGEIMGRDITSVIDDVDGVALFENWVDSPGARLECYTAYLLGKEIRIVRIARDGSVRLDELSNYIDLEQGLLH